MSVKRLSEGDEGAMENHRMRMAHGDPRPDAHHHHEGSNRRFSGFFDEVVVVQHDTYYVTDFCRVGKRVFSLHGERPPAMFRHGRRSCAATCHITREDRATVPRTSHGHWFRGRQTPELLLYFLPGTIVVRRQYAKIHYRTTTQRPSTSTTAVPVRIRSFGNGTPETGNPIHRQRQ